MDRPTEPPPSAPKSAKVVRRTRWLLPRLPLLVGVVGLGGAVTTATWFKRQVDERDIAEAQAIRAELGGLKAQAGEYRLRMANLRWSAEQSAGLATETTEEPLRTWLRERATRRGDLVAEIERRADEARFRTESEAVERLCAAGEIAGAREKLLKLPEVTFPGPVAFAKLEARVLREPLAAFSRQNPAYYRAFQTFEPEAARQDIAALRRELAAEPLDEVTPQAMLRYELLAAVAPPDDPQLADWAALATAADFFENPDAKTLAAWRQAQRAWRLQDWGGARAHMQSILRTTVRTRQPFRAAYARAILKNTPDDKAAAYPFMAEAAAAGDAAARAWVAQEDLAQGRPAMALRWLEAAVLAGDAGAVAPLLQVYARADVARDEGRETGVLLRILTAPDAPPLASMLLARLYENGAPEKRSEALAYYERAAGQRHVPAWAEVARGRLRGWGGAADYDGACAWAVRAFEAGEREKALPLLIELMQRAPDRAANAIQEMLEHEQVASAAGFSDVRVGGPSMAQLQTLLGRYFDQQGKFSEAARFYARSGSRDPAVLHRHAELTTARACETCGGTGKIQSFTPCPTCGGKGTVICGVCDGRGYSYVPGTPPCTTCGGSGAMEQDGRTVACSACGGTGKGKGSVVKQECPACMRGRTACRECTGGRIKTLKECPDCHGTGARALADD